MSGHSHWARVKHKKALTDVKKGKLFSKMVREITVAAKEAGPVPEANPRLRSALEHAKSIGLPKDNIERAIARASGSEEGTALQEFLYEATFPGGIMLLISGITDNKNRALAEIKQIALGRGAKLVPQNSLLWNFEKIWTEDHKNYLPKTKIKIPPQEIEKLTQLLDTLEEQEDVQNIYTNV